MDGKGHTAFKTVKDRREQWVKVKDLPTTELPDPGTYIGINLQQLPTLEQTRLGRYKKQKREDMAKALASMTDEERKKFMAEVRSRRADAEEAAAI